jgi:hypothetical protein
MEAHAYEFGVVERTMWNHLFDHLYSYNRFPYSFDCNYMYIYIDFLTNQKFNILCS